MASISYKKIFANDHKAFLLAVIGPVALGISVYSGFFGASPTGNGTEKVDPKFAIFGCVVSVLITIGCLVVLWLRLSRIQQILAKGPRTAATISAVRTTSEATLIDLDYVIKGRAVKSTSKVFKSKEMEHYAQGHQVEVAVNPKNTKEAYILELYSA